MSRLAACKRNSLQGAACFRSRSIKMTATTCVSTGPMACTPRSRRRMAGNRTWYCNTTQKTAQVLSGGIPLDFSDRRSRVSYLFGFENLQEKRRIVQRAVDINYFPSALLSDGQADVPLEDYWGIVARAAARWPVRTESWRLRLSTEVGYAPNTPTKTATGITARATQVASPGTLLQASWTLYRITALA